MPGLPPDTDLAARFRANHDTNAKTQSPPDSAIDNVVRFPFPPDYVTVHTTTPDISLFRLYTLRLAYLILAVGLGIYIWPAVIHHTSESAITHGVQIALLAGIGLTAVLGLRYPLQMLPLLLFEIIWKAIYLTAFALPLWSAHQITAAAAEDIKACLWVVIFLFLIPWRYVFAHYIRQHGDRWS